MLSDFRKLGGRDVLAVVRRLPSHRWSDVQNVSRGSYFPRNHKHPPAGLETHELFGLAREPEPAFLIDESLPLNDSKHRLLLLLLPNHARPQRQGCHVQQRRAARSASLRVALTVLARFRFLLQRRRPSPALY